MMELPVNINENTHIMSDPHFGHVRVLTFETVRIKRLAEYNSNVKAECNELLKLASTVPNDDQRKHTRIQELNKFLITFHDKMLVEGWNNSVGEDDTILCVGDFAFKGIEEHTSKLKGKKVLLKGNHDQKTIQHYKDCGWSDVIENVRMLAHGKMFEMIPQSDKFCNALLTEINGLKMLISHFPIYNNNPFDVKKFGGIAKMLAELYESYNGELNIYGHTHSKLSAYDKSISVSVENCENMAPVRIGDLLEKNGYKKK